MQQVMMQMLFMRACYHFERRPSSYPIQIDASAHPNGVPILQMP